jgi:hypothetical protein
MRRLFNSPQMSTGAMIIAVAALCIAVAGGAFAAAKLKKNSVSASNIKKNAVTKDKIAAGAVSGDKLAAGAVAGKIVITRAIGETITVPDGESRAGQILCPAGSQAIAGGAAIVGPANGDSNAGMISSRRDATDATLWVIRMGNDMGASRSWDLTATCIALG